MFGSPGSLTMYSTASRSGLPAPNDTPPSVGPASYHVKPIQCRPCMPENVAPFLNTEISKGVIPNGYPSPLDYYPYKRPRYEIGVPIMGRSERFKSGRFNSVSPGPRYKIPDPWVVLLEECVTMHSKRWRVKYDKYVSNNIPSVFHPLELRAFVTGVDGRMYPLRNKEWKPKIPNPIYNTSNILTSRSPNPRVVDFSHSGERPPLFKPRPGFGPADFTIPQCLNLNGGIFLSKTDSPKWSSYRLFDFIVCKASKTIYPSPFNHYIQSCFDKMSPKAVSGAFKSRTKRFSYGKKTQSPSPCEYFRLICSVNDLIPPVYPRYPNYFTMPPEPAPFNCTEERFQDPALYEQAFSRPSPCSYRIPTFTDLLWCRCKTSKPAICNPKLGFLTSAKARSDSCFKTCDYAEGNMDYGKAARSWRNVRPRRIKTFAFHGPPSGNYFESPGPIYDTSSGYKVLKGRNDWWDPRHATDVGFNCSGCSRKVSIAPVDKDIPGPGRYYAELPKKRCLGGTIKTTGARTRKFETVGPGPTHKIHAKFGSSTWRGTHLGTFNVYLKGVNVQRPSAGGFRPHGPLDRLGNISSGLDPTDPDLSQFCSLEIKRIV